MAEIVDIQYDKRKLRQLEKTLRGIPNGMPKVLSRAVNKTASGARTKTVRGVAQEINLKQSGIRKSIRLDKATYSNPQAIVSLTGRRIPLIYFKARQLKKGIKYAIDKGSSSLITYDKDTSPVFITKVRGSNAKAAAQFGDGGHTGVFKRMSKKRKSIIELKGPSLPQVFDNADALSDTIKKETAQNLEKNISTQVDLILKRK